MRDQRTRARSPVQSELRHSGSRPHHRGDGPPSLGAGAALDNRAAVVGSRVPLGRVRALLLDALFGAAVAERPDPARRRASPASMRLRTGVGSSVRPQSGSMRSDPARDASLLRWPTAATSARPPRLPVSAAGSGPPPIHPLRWTVSDGVHLERFEAPESYDAVISDQVIEHLHPDDLVAHFAGVHAILKPGGRYALATPHAFEGPFDVSRVFGSERPQGMHLKEYTYRELQDGGVRRRLRADRRRFSVASCGARSMRPKTLPQAQPQLFPVSVEYRARHLTFSPSPAPPRCSCASPGAMAVRHYARRARA